MRLYSSHQTEQPQQARNVINKHPNCSIQTSAVGLTGLLRSVEYTISMGTAHNDDQVNTIYAIFVFFSQVNI